MIAKADGEILGALKALDKLLAKSDETVVAGTGVAAGV